MRLAPFSFPSTCRSLLAVLCFRSSAHANQYHIPPLTPWEQIESTLTLYARAIDTKDFALLSSVFASNAFANYTGYLSNLNGLPAIQAGLETAVAKIDTQHLLGSIGIDIAEHGDVVVANSTTYFQASLFGKGPLVGKVLYQYGFYADDLILVGDGGWRISRRELVFQGPGMIGDEAVIGE